jgi:hypothetical protein
MALKIRAITAGCMTGAVMAWSEIGRFADDGLRFREWVAGILAGVAVGGGTALAGYFAMRWVNRRYLGEEDDG